MEGDDRGERDARDERGNWFVQQLGEGWSEVEPGIYRLDTGVKTKLAASPSEPASHRDLLEALNPAADEPEPVQPTRRLFRRRTQTIDLD